MITISLNGYFWYIVCLAGIYSHLFVWVISGSRRTYGPYSQLLTIFSVYLYSIKFLQSFFFFLFPFCLFISSFFLNVLTSNSFLWSSSFKVGGIGKLRNPQAEVFVLALSLFNIYNLYKSFNTLLLSIPRLANAMRAVSFYQLS